MDGIAAAAGVTKRTLYYHFESKDAVLAAVLDRQSEHALALFRRMGRKPAASQAELLDVVFGGIERWAAKRRWLGSGYTRLTMELADLPGHPARGSRGGTSARLRNGSPASSPGCGRPSRRRWRGR